MLAFTGKYGTGCLYLNNCVHGLESFLYLKLYNIYNDFCKNRHG